MMKTKATGFPLTLALTGQIIRHVYAQPRWIVAAVGGEVLSNWINIPRCVSLSSVSVLLYLNNLLSKKECTRCVA